MTVLSKLPRLAVGSNLISQGVMKLERVQVICPGCGQQVEAVATDGRVKGYCAVAQQYVDFPIETQLGMTAQMGSEVSASTAAKKRWQYPEYRARQSANQKKHWQDPEYRARQSAARKKLWQDPEFRAKQSANQKKVWQDPEYRAKQSVAVKKRGQDPEYRARQSAAAKKRWQHPEYRARRSANLIGRHLTAETKGKISAAVTR